MTDRPSIWNGISIPYGAPLSELRALLEGPVPERWAAFYAVAATPGREALDLLLQYGNSPDHHVRRAALEAIGHHSEGRLAADIVLAALQDDSAFVVRTACAAAAELGLLKAHERLRALLTDDPEEQTRWAAVDALAVLWETSDHDALVTSFTTDKSDEVRKRAAWALRERVTRETWLQLFTLWRDAALPRYRTWACELAGTFGGAAQVEDLERLSQDDNGHVRSAAHRALQWLQGAG